MRGRLHTSRWIPLLAIALAGALSLACGVPSLLTGSNPTLLPSPTATSIPSPRALSPTVPLPPKTSASVVKVTDEQMNNWLKETPAPLGQDIECRNMHLSIRSTGIILSATVAIAQLRSAAIPMEIQMRPAVRGQRVEVEVVDVRMGGPYAAWSGLVKPLINAGLAQAFDANAFLAEQGVRVSNIELHDGYMLITSEPAEATATP